MDCPHTRQRPIQSRVNLRSTNDLIVKFQSFRSPYNCHLDISIISKAVKRLRANSENIGIKMMMATRSQKDRLEVPKMVSPPHLHFHKELVFSVISSLKCRPQLFKPWGHLMSPTQSSPAPTKVFLKFHTVEWMFSFPCTLKVDFPPLLFLLLQSSVFMKRPLGINSRPM